MGKVQSHSPSSGGYKPQSAGNSGGGHKPQSSGSAGGSQKAQPTGNSTSSQGPGAHQHSFSGGQNKPKTDTFESSKSLFAGGGDNKGGGADDARRGGQDKAGSRNPFGRFGHGAGRAGNGDGATSPFAQKSTNNAAPAPSDAGAAAQPPAGSDASPAPSDAGAAAQPPAGSDAAPAPSDAGAAAQPPAGSDASPAPSDAGAAAQPSAGSDGSNSATPPAGNASQQPSSGNVTLFGGSQSGENNIAFANNSGKDMYVYAQKGNQPGEQDAGGTVFKVPAGSSVTANALDDNGLRFQSIDGSQLTPDQQNQLNQNGSVTGITAPAQTGTLYESNYVSGKHLSYDDISPLDGANTPMSLSGTGGRTVDFSQQEIAGAPVHNPDGSVPGLGPSASPTDNNAANPALRDYYANTSLQPDGTRAFYYNSSVGGDADKANVSYTGAPGQVRATVTLG